MKLISTILFLFFFIKSECQVNFTPYASNPIITKHTGSWDSVDVANPDVFYDSLNRRWVMDYSGYGIIPGLTDTLKWRTGLAYSTDLITWTKDALNPIFSPTAAEGYIAANCSIVYKSGTYYMFYNTAKIDGSMNYIRLATSTDLHTWTRQNSGNPVSIPTDSYNSSASYDPCVILLSDGVTFEMVFAALGSANSIGRARSTDGITWTAYNPLFTLQRWFITSNFAEPGIFRNGSALYLTWDAPLVANYRKIGGAVSFDNGKSWQQYGFLADAGTGWNAAQVFDSKLIIYNGTAYLFYAGAPVSGGTQGMGAQIGLSIGKLIDR